VKWREALLRPLCALRALRTLPEESGLLPLGAIPENVRITARLTPMQTPQAYGLTLRAVTDYSQGYEVRLSPSQGTLEVRRTLAGPFPAPSPNAIYAVAGMDRAVTLEIICQGDIIDVCLNGTRCLAARLPQRQADGLYLFCQNGAVGLEELTVEAR